MLAEAQASHVLALVKSDYKAFDAPTNDKQEGFTIQARLYGKIVIGFTMFFQASCDDAGETMVLMFAHQLIRLRGHFLDTLIEPLRLKSLQAMREFDTRKHLAPDPDACVIASIEVFSKTDPEELE